MPTRNSNIIVVDKMPKCDTCDSLAVYELEIEADESHTLEVYACEDCKENQRDVIITTKNLKLRKENRYSK